ncbi:hypothetical protein MTR67_038420 [Solanum verrucosum]|uniref:Leucine-rich repeat-containing N-terminal plant-type domain-containing protein n=1 Tax=Solanum verrucosum TaxID=315347 RepID=A0AAF0ZPM9_SOLVR|nr:hypothetical protein MTR67_038420 [Solanum verrucosum]
MTTLYFLWLFLIPLFQILSGYHIFLVSSQCLDDQKSLLLQLKGSLRYDSTLSNKLAKWNQKTSESCNWDGVTCDLSGHVIALELDDETISSGIENASALFSLQYLERLNLAYNRFSVGIPVGIGNLTNLKYLNLSNAGFVGQIPMMLSRLTKLVTLDLSPLFPYSNQRLKLENPNLRHFIENSTELRELYLDGVDLSSLRTEWCPIDESLSKLQILSIIRLDQNNLSTTVPGYFANFTNLTTLSLDSCNLQGAFPKKIFQVQFLEILDLSNNKLLSGSIPSFPRNGSLRMISLSNTNFSGSLPESISNLQSLSSGTVPLDLIGRLSNLTRLELSYNNLTVDASSINSTSFIFPQLRLLKLASCRLQKFPDLKRRIPESICNASYLQVLDFSNNALSGTIPPCLLENSTNLGVLNLGNNKLNGVIPDSFPIGCALQTLDLSENKLQGRLPKSLVNCELLEVLNVGNNKLVDRFPCMLRNSNSLRVLFLRSNQFNGSVQCDATRNNWKNLQIIDIASNNFTGVLNAEFFSNWKGMMVADDNVETGRNHIQYKFLQLS